MANAHWPPKSKRAAVWIDWLLAGAIAAYLLAQLPVLTAWPPVNGDEGREANAFWVASGIDPSASSLDPVFKHDPLYKGGLQGLTTATSYRIFGFGLFQGRVVSLVWGGVLLWSTFLAGRRLFGSVAAVFAVLLLGVSQPFLISSHIIRPDVVVAALVMMALWATLRGIQDGGRHWHLVSGLLLGLSFDVHPNTLAFMPLVALSYLAAYRGRCLRVREPWLFASGLAIGGLYYIGARVAPDPAHYFEAFGYWIGVDKRPPLMSARGSGAIQAELSRWTSYFSHRYLEGALLAIGVLVAAWRAIRGRSLDVILCGVVVAFGVFVALVSSKTEYYVILFFPALSLLLGDVIADARSRLSGSRVLATVLMVIMALSAMGFEDNTRDMIEASTDLKERDYGVLSAQLQAAIPPGSRVVGPPIYWIGLAQQPYYLDFVDFYVWERVRREKSQSWPEFLRDVDPSHVILDSKAKNEVVRTGMTRFMDDNAELITSIRHVNYGRVEVWKMRGPSR